MRYGACTWGARTPVASPEVHIAPHRPMRINRFRLPQPQADADEGVGIVVHGRPVSPEPRTASFVWGPEEHHAPSLPFGRWKARAA